MEITLNKKLKRFVTEEWRYKIAYGGRGSSKSWTIARMLLLLGMSSKLRIVCGREIQNSIKDSVHKLLKDQIEMLGLAGYKATDNRISHENGTEFLFVGLYTNISKIKSFEGIDIFWIEEGESISTSSWEILDPTIRKPGSEVWVSYNPRYESDIIHKTFVLGDAPDNALVIKVNWQDNKYFPTELVKQKDRMAKTDPDLYMHIWEGALKRNTEEQVLHNRWCIEEFKSIPHETDYYFGADWGFSNDPNTLTRVHTGEHAEYGTNCLYIEYEANDRPYNQEARNTSTGLDGLPLFWGKIPGSDEGMISADCARPETINYMNNKGYNVVAAPKWGGSVQDGIEHLRAYDKVIIHPRCTNVLWEFQNYKYKVNARSGQVTNKVVDNYNHHIDGIRYALNGLIKGTEYNYDDLI